jgi:hypothetical protein
MLYGYKMLYGKKIVDISDSRSLRLPQKLLIFLSLAGVAFKLLTKTELKMTYLLFTSVVDPDPYESVSRSGLDPDSMGSLDPYPDPDLQSGSKPDPGGQNDPQTYKKLINFIF